MTCARFVGARRVWEAKGGMHGGSLQRRQQTAAAGAARGPRAHAAVPPRRGYRRRRRWCVRPRAGCGVRWVGGGYHGAYATVSVHARGLGGTRSWRGHVDALAAFLRRRRGQKKRKGAYASVKAHTGAQCRCSGDRASCSQRKATA